MKHCPTCNEPRPISVDMGPDMRMTERCDRGHVVPEAPVAVSAPAPMRPPTPRKATAVPTDKPLDVVKLAKRRLREVRREIKVLREREREAKQLERLIAAAEDKVRPLKAVAS